MVKDASVVDELPNVASPVTLRVDVAVIAPPKKPVPLKYALPLTSSLLFGVVVPMPTLPLL